MNAQTSDQAIDLPWRGVVDAEQAGVHHAVGADAAFAAEEAHEHQRRGGDQFADAQRDHGEGGGALLGRQPAEDDSRRTARRARRPAAPARSAARSRRPSRDARRARRNSRPARTARHGRTTAGPPGPSACCRTARRSPSCRSRSASSARSRNGGPCSSRRTARQREREQDGHDAASAGQRQRRPMAAQHRSCVARPHQPARPEHQDQHQHQERQQGADPRQRSR